MDTPLIKALGEQMATGRSRFHMPGHKGVLPPPLRGCAPYDFTEVPLTDSLYEADGPLLELERRFSRLYGTAHSLLSAGGSTLCIQTMLALAAAGGELLCERGVHTSAVSAMGLLGIGPHWLYPPRARYGIPLPVTPAQVEAGLCAHPQVQAVYITSPTYYGFLADIAGIAEVCHRHQKPLLVDGAHGAHLPFLGQALHPIAQGADLCCDSLHKMLPALTGAALLHLQEERFLPQAKVRMSWFGSTSPSYLILLSMDLLCGQLEGDLPARLQAAAGRLADLMQTGAARGVPLIGGEGCDPLRLTLPLRPLGMTAEEMLELLYAQKIEPELCSPLGAVLLAGADTAKEDWQRLQGLLGALPAGEDGKAGEASPVLHAPPRRLSIREAMLGESEALPPECAAGRVAAAMVTPCPPGIPVIMPGEILDGETIFLLKSYGITSVNVVK